MRRALVVALSVTTMGCATGNASSYVVSIYSAASSEATSRGDSSQSSSQNQSSTAATSDESSASTAANLPSSIIVGASALLLGAVGGIITTVYQNSANAKAKLEAEEFRKLHPAQVPTLPATPPPTEQLPPPNNELTPPPTVPAPQARREPSFDAMVMARSWLLANRLQLKQDLALGAGPALDDLAGIAQIPPAHREYFGHLLQKHRGAFGFDETLTPQRAAELMSQVGELVMADPVVALDGARASR